MTEFKIGSYSIEIPTSFGPEYYPVKKKEFQKGIANLEIGMNWAGYIIPFLPFIGDLPSTLRIMGGSLEAGIGLTMTAVHYAQATYWETEEEKQEQAMDRVWESWDYAQHGMANIGRGCLERIRVVNLLVAFFWDFAGKRMKYQAEKEIDLQKAQKKAGVKV